jgi:hypothetical protein
VVARDQGGLVDGGLDVDGIADAEVDGERA